MCRRIALVVVAACLLLPEIGHGRTLSKEEVNALWEDLLRKEEYRAIEYFNRKLTEPTTDKHLKENRIIVIEAREGFLWGLFGLSEGGGWSIDGRLEVEVRTAEGLLQLFSKATKKWFPGFAWFWMPGYDQDTYPVWEFLLVYRDKTDPQRMRVVWSTRFGPQNVAHPSPVGERYPRGQLQYDPDKGIAVVKIVGLEEPIIEEVRLESGD